MNIFLLSEQFLLQLWFTTSRRKDSFQICYSFPQNVTDKFWRCYFVSLRVGGKTKEDKQVEESYFLLYDRQTQDIFPGLWKFRNEKWDRMTTLVNGLSSKWPRWKNAAACLEALQSRQTVVHPTAGSISKWDWRHRDQSQRSADHWARQKEAQRHERKLLTDAEETLALSWLWLIS